MGSRVEVAAPRALAPSFWISVAWIAAAGGAFKSPGSAQKFLSAHAAVYNIFNVQRHLTSAKTHRTLRAAAIDTWRTAVTAA